MQSCLAGLLVSVVQTVDVAVLYLAVLTAVLGAVPGCADLL